MNASPAIVVTSIFQPSPALREIAKGAAANGYELIVIGDSGHTGSSSMREALDSAGDRIFTAITGQR